MRIAILLSLALFAVTGCQVARMQVDPALVNVNALPVHGYTPHTLNEPISFGQWKTSRIEEGWTKEKWIRLLDQGEEILGYAKYHKPYRYDIPTASGTVNVECVIRAKAVSHRGAMIDVGMLRQLPPLRCIYDGAVAGDLQLLQQFTVALSEIGEMQFPSDRWQVRSTSRLEGTPAASGTIVGYEILDDDTIIAAVEVMNEGRVWIAPTLAPSDQERAAAVATSLLLYSLLYEPLESAAE